MVCVCCGMIDMPLDACLRERCGGRVVDGQTQQKRLITYCTESFLFNVFFPMPCQNINAILINI